MLGTVDGARGVHLVPVVFVVSGNELVVPIDSLKPKSSRRLRRVDNLQADGRASIVVDHASDDWSELWWIRADLEFVGSLDPEEPWLALLASKYPQYRNRSTIDSLLLFTIGSVRGWTGSASD